ncbi:MAG: hypothetical protein JJ840_08090 [Prochlorococcus marinus CUG1431]|uniref:Uncharacterized protein n=1 Tax=Prochlorococcus marinus CUG1433 TaxID=2774506 RepID=A0A9D9G2H6_PROMR|nr:hypothetical protein [Prochlorococcus marinus CUG1433]MBO6981306.1 hypothetical protein [Prochlorococcus marinus CUG1431]
MVKKNLFVTLGKYGKVSKNLGKEFVKNDLEYESISWKDINNKGLLSKLINLRSTIKNKYNDILFIDCLIGSNNYIEESNLHLNNLKETKKIFPNSIYIFLSTFEPDSNYFTSYRDTKRKLENLIFKNNGSVIRIGWAMNRDDELLLSKRKRNFPKFAIKDFSNNHILIPGTRINDLLMFLNKKLENGKLYRCYSYFLFMIFELSLVPRLYFEKKCKTNFSLPLPVGIIIFSLRTIINILKKIHINTRLIDIIEKPYSLLIQQTIIKNYKKSQVTLNYE